MLDKIKKILPFVYPWPFSTFKQRNKEKWHHFKMVHSLLYAREVGVDSQNLTTLKFRKDCILGKKGSYIKAPKDEIIFSYVKNLGFWAIEESVFLGDKINLYLRDNIDPNPLFLDLGANIGLSSIQLSNLLEIQSDMKYLLVEPISAHLSAIRFNIHNNPFLKDAIICPFALASHTGKGMMLINEKNRGASSLADLINNDVEGKYENVQTVRVEDFEHEYLQGDETIFLKSDIEGLDHVILGNLSDNTWKRIYAGVIEVIPNPNLDQVLLNQLIRFLEKYQHLSWDPDHSYKLLHNEIVGFWTSTDIFLARNLYFSEPL